MANIDIIEREGLVARVAALEPVLDTAVRRLASLPLVGLALWCVLRSTPPP